MLNKLIVFLQKKYEKARKIFQDLPERLSIFLLSRIPFGERIILGLWTGVIAAAVAGFASAAPYIFSEADKGMQCGALAITTASKEIIKSSVLVIVIISIWFNITRIILHVRSFQSLIIGFLFWIAMATSSLVVFYDFFYQITFIVADPPNMPDNRSDRVACRSLIVNARPPDPVLDFLTSRLGRPLP